MTIFSTFINDEDQNFDNQLRPKKLSDFIGQQKIKENLKIFIKAAKQRKEPLEHLLLYGPPGLGKTTLANIISNEMKSDIKTVTGPAIERSGDLAAILTNLKENDVLFIDEIHRLPRLIEEMLYPALEDFKLDIVMGKGPGAKTLSLSLNRFTFIGATTRAGAITKPLRDRFGINLRLDYYNNEEIIEIVKRSAKILNIEIDSKGAQIIGCRSRGTPRFANRLLKRVRDFAQVLGSGKIDMEIAEKTLDRLEVDDLGLEDMDRKLIKTIIDNYSGGPVGIETLAVTLGESRDTIEDIYEPYLIQIGFLNRTNRGRCVTKKAYKYFGYTSNNAEDQNRLF